MPSNKRTYSVRRVTKRSGAPSTVVSRSSYRVRRRINYQRNKNGFLKLSRKIPEIVLYNQTTANTVGHYSISGNPASNVLQFGTPVFNTGTGTCDVPFAMCFRLDQMYNPNDLINLCDQYMMKRADIKIFYQSVPYGDAAPVTGGNNNNILSLPTIEYIDDYDDFNVPSVADFREKMGVKRKSFKNWQTPVKMSVYPKLNQEIQTTTGTGLAVAGQKWIDSIYANTIHYGIKGIIKNLFLPSVTTQAVRNSLTFDITYKIYGKDFQ